MLDQVYGAIADPTRRAILAILAEGETNVGGLADRFPISLNGVSKHVKVLERAGLVERTVQGREHRLRLNAEPLREATMWLEHYRAFWGARLMRWRLSCSSTMAAEDPRAGTPARRGDDGHRGTRSGAGGAAADGRGAGAGLCGLARFRQPGPLDASAGRDPRDRYRGSASRWRLPDRDGGPGPRQVEHTGEYLAIEPPSRLSFTWVSKHTDHRPTVVTIEFHERGTGTELVLTHRGLPPQEIEAHRGGWTDIMRLLEEALHPEAATGAVPSPNVFPPSEISRQTRLSPARAAPAASRQGIPYPEDTCLRRSRPTGLRHHRRGRSRSFALLAGASAVSAQTRALAGALPSVSPELEQARAALDKYRDPIVAVHDGYFSTVGCIEYPAGGHEGTMQYAPGGMGVHFLNLQLIGPTLDPAKPQVLIYEPDGDKLRLAAAEWFLPVAGRPGRGPSGDLRQGAGRPDGRASSSHAGRSTPLRPARLALEGEPCRDLRPDQPQA